MSADSSDIAASYDAWAATYDVDANPTRDLDAAVLRAAALIVAGCDVLEIGCGTGKNTAWLAERAKTVTALDVSTRMLEQARTRLQGRRVLFIEHDIRAEWPIGGSSIDLVVGNLVLEHVEHLPPVFAETFRVLRPGGRAFFCELHPERQRKGGRAQFVDPLTGGTVYVAAHLHTISEFVNTGLDEGLTLRRLGEHLEDGAAADAPPRLLSLLFAK